jgi:signal transduction histidine kinase
VVAGGVDGSSGTVLAEMALAVARAETVDEIMRVVSEVVGREVGAANAYGGLIDSSGRRLRIFHGPAPSDAGSRFATINVDDSSPQGRSVMRAEPVFLPSFEAFRCEFPILASRLESQQFASTAAVPMHAGGRLVGSVNFRWERHVDFSPELKEMLARTAEVLGAALLRASAHDQLVATSSRLAESNRDLENFAAALAHDLRQPLRQLSSFVQLLLESVGGDGASAVTLHYGDRIAAASGRAESLLDGLLRYARVGGKPMLDERVQLAQLTREVVESLRPALDDAGATVRFDAEQLPTVRGDPDLLRQVVHNLLENAVKFRDPSRRLLVTVQARSEAQDAREGAWWRICVEDNGLGIAPDHLGAVFDLFSRAPTSHVPGDGIGLALCRRIIERHGGQTDVESTVGQGSTFWFTVRGAAPRHPA